MSARIPYLVVVLLALLPMSLAAQSGKIISREKLDSLVTAKNSAKGVGALLISPATIDLGEVGADEEVYFNFEVKNISQHSITTTEFRCSCGCINVETKPQSIAPNETLRVAAKFDPTGRNSAFRYRINIYTDLDSELPTERVMVEGRVVNDDEWLHLPQHAGVLRLSRKEVTLSSRGRERIAVANSGDRAITITAKPMVEGLTLRCEPEVLQPNAEGNIYISYSGEIASELSTILILEGIESSPAERMIKVKLKK